MIFFGLSFLYLIWHGLNQKGISEGGLKTARLVLYSLPAVCGIAFLLLYFFSEEMHYYIIPLLPGHGRYPWPDYWLLSLTHLVDIANLFLLMIPAGLLLVFFVSRTKFCNRDEINRFLLYFSAAGILFLFLIEPKLGIGRDWDLFAPAGVCYCLAALYFITRHVRGSPAVNRLLVADHTTQASSTLPDRRQGRATLRPYARTGVYRSGT